MMLCKKPYVLIEKNVGETPLQATEVWRTKAGIPLSTPLAYAGRLDPLASGSLLVLIGEECKKQTAYHGLDKEYVFEVLLGFSTDTGDVLGVATRGISLSPDKEMPQGRVEDICKKLLGDITLPYPHFSSKTVRGKPLHVWTLEGRLNEITIPTNTATIYKLAPVAMRTIAQAELARWLFEKINSIATVTEESKALGRDFRREEIRARWKTLFAETPNAEYTILTFRCIASSGMYMRSLAEVIGKNLGTVGLAYSIHRTTIGKYKKIGPFGFWLKRFR